MTLTANERTAARIFARARHRRLNPPATPDSADTERHSDDWGES